MSAALLLLLGLSAPLRAPDLQVEATTRLGTDLPELADAVARALVAGGARVVLGGSTSAPCLYCARIVVVEGGEGICLIDVKQEHHSASATLKLPPGSPLFDRARAIAIQARLLVTWETSPNAKPADASARRTGHRPERRASVHRATAEAALAQGEPPVPTTGQTRPAPDIPAEPTPKQVPEVAPARRHVDTAAPTANVERGGVKSVARPVTKPTEADSIRTERARALERPSVGAALGRRQWPWIPTLLGSGAAVAAGICAIVARSRYNALSDKSQSYASAQALKSEGQSWQTVSLVFSGVAMVGLGAGITGFVTRSPVHASVAAAPIPGGGLFTIAGDLP